MSVPTCPYQVRGTAAVVLPIAALGLLPGCDRSSSSGQSSTDARNRNTSAPQDSAEQDGRRVVELIRDSFAKLLKEEDDRSRRSRGEPESFFSEFRYDVVRTDSVLHPIQVVIQFQLLWGGGALVGPKTYQAELRLAGSEGKWRVVDASMVDPKTREKSAYVLASYRAALRRAGSGLCDD